MSDTAHTSYDLIDRPWILVHRLDGQVEEVSLLDLFHRAHELRSVLGDVPTQSFAIMRLLLAILHRAVDGPPDEERWAQLWRQPEASVPLVTDYLTTVRHRFDLLAGETPFYQVAGLHTAKGETSGLERLIADVPVNSYFFTTRLGSGIARLSFPEAARWLVHCQAYDVSGIKSGAVGDPRVKNGKGYPIGTGWAGALGGVIAEGATLQQTLLLNLIPDSELSPPDAANDLPAWERRPHDAAPEFEDGYAPAGPLQLYTWQSRRIRLVHDGDGVHGVLISNGDKITPQNRHRAEPLSIWRRSPAQEKATGEAPIYMPKVHEPERAVWRGLAALLQDNRNAMHGKDAAATLRPAVLDWLDRARTYGLLEDGYQVRTRTIGMAYGGKAATIEEVVDDAVAVAVVLLGGTGAELRATAIDAVRDAEEVAKAIGDLAGNLAEAAGGEAGGARDRAREVAYSQLDAPFRSWLARLSPDSSAPAARTEWQRTANKLALELGRELVQQAGPAAWRGRDVNKRHVSSPEADTWFHGKLRQVLSFAYQTESTSKDDIEGQA